MVENVYTLKIEQAIKSGNREVAIDLIGEALGSMTKMILEQSEKVPALDLRFFVAAIQLLGKSMVGILEDGGREMVRLIVENTGVVAIDLGKLKKQLHENE